MGGGRKKEVKERVKEIWGIKHWFIVGKYSSVELGKIRCHEGGEN